MNQTGEWLGFDAALGVVVSARGDRRPPDPRVRANGFQGVIRLGERVLVVGAGCVLAVRVLRLPEAVDVRLVADDEVRDGRPGGGGDERDEARERRLRAVARADQAGLRGIDGDDELRVVRRGAGDGVLEAGVDRAGAVPLHGDAEVGVADVVIGGPPVRHCTCGTSASRPRRRTAGGRRSSRWRPSPKLLLGPRQWRRKRRQPPRRARAFSRPASHRASARGRAVMRPRRASSEGTVKRI